jgi:hypothetical protein
MDRKAAARWFIALGMLLASATASEAAAPRPPKAITAKDQPWDAGGKIEVTIARSEDDVADAAARTVTKYVVQIATEEHGVFKDAVEVEAAGLKTDWSRPVVATVEKLKDGRKHWFRAAAVNAGGERSAWVDAPEPAISSEQWFDKSRGGFFVMLAIICGAIIGFIAVARSGVKLWIRRITGLDAIDEAVGRATEMGRPCLFIAGVQDLNEIETLAGITVLSRVAQKAAEYDATVVMPTSRSLVMTAARETTQAAYLTAGRPDAYQEDRIYYVTDEQFGFVAHVTGLIQREKPAACFYMGQFFAESLMLGETGNTVGAIQIAGSAQPAQLPFFVAACDYTLIGEEFFAASAYLSGDPDQLGSLKGQDIGKMIVMGLLFVGCGLLTIATVVPSQQWAMSAAELLKDVLLKSS